MARSLQKQLGGTVQTGSIDWRMSTSKEAHITATQGVENGDHNG